MNRRLFSGQAAREWATGDSRDLSTFLGYAEQLNLNRADMQQCIETSRYAAQIENDVRAASEKGINSTPAFLINGQVLYGARPFASWKQLFDSMLSK